MGVPDEVAALQRPRLSGIEGLRAVAALSVLTYHVWLFTPANGSLPFQLPHRGDRLLFDLRFGLTLFFVLSGFLLYRPFAAAVVETRPLPSIRRYFRSRALRILPAYWVVLVAAALILQTAVVSWPPFQTGALTDPHKLVTDLLLVQNYDPSTIITGIGPAWSLGVEAVFYLLLPVLAAGALQLARRARRRSVIACALVPAAVLLIVGVATHVALAHGLTNRIGRWDTAVRLSFPAQADYFSFGMAAAVVHVLVVRRGASIGPRLRTLAALAAVSAIAVTVYFAPMDSNRAQAAGWDTVIATGCATLLLVTCLPGAGRQRLLGVLEWRPLTAVGLASYSVYLWHTPVIFLLHRWGVTSHGGLSLLGCFALALATTLALSALSYRFVEKPMLARKHGRGLARLETAAAAP